MKKFIYQLFGFMKIEDNSSRISYKIDLHNRTIVYFWLSIVLLIILSIIVSPWFFGIAMILVVISAILGLILRVKLMSSLWKRGNDFDEVNVQGEGLGKGTVTFEKHDK